MDEEVRNDETEQCVGGIDEGWTYGGGFWLATSSAMGETVLRSRFRQTEEEEREEERVSVRERKGWSARTAIAGKVERGCYTAGTRVVRSLSVVGHVWIGAFKFDLELWNSPESESLRLYNFW